MSGHFVTNCLKGKWFPCMTPGYWGWSEIKGFQKHPCDEYDPESEKSTTSQGTKVLAATISNYVNRCNDVYMAQLSNYYSCMIL